MYQESFLIVAFTCPGFETAAAIERDHQDRSLGWDRPDSARAPSLGLALATELTRLLGLAGVSVRLDVEYYAIRMLLERGTASSPLQLGGSDGETWGISSLGSA